MRILHVTPYASDAWAYGGIPRVVGALTRSLASRGHDVTVVTTDAFDASARLHGVAPAFDGVTRHVFPNLSNALAYRQQLFLPVGLASYMRRHAGDFDVAHLHACRNLPGAIAARHLQRARVPYVLAPNGTAPNIERHQMAKRGFDAIAGRGVLLGASRVIAVAEAERRQLLTLGVAADRIATVPNPIDLDEFATRIPTGRFRQRLNLPHERLVMFLGKQTPRKRVDVLARAFAAIRASDAHLVIAGNEIGRGSSLRSLVRGLEIAPRTHFVGLLRGPERLEALADADVLVYPSEHEVFGLVPLEALLCGTPVIVANDCGCGDIINAVGGGIVTPLGDVDALAHAINLLLESIAAWRAHAADAGVRVRASYGHQIVTLQLQAVYELAVEGSLDLRLGTSIDRSGRKPVAGALRRLRLDS